MGTAFLARGPALIMNPILEQKYFCNIAMQIRALQEETHRISGSSLSGFSCYPRTICYAGTNLAPDYTLRPSNLQCNGAISTPAIYFRAGDNSSICAVLSSNQVMLHVAALEAKCNIQALYKGEPVVPDNILA